MTAPVLSPAAAGIDALTVSQDAQLVAAEQAAQAAAADQLTADLALLTTAALVWWQQGSDSQSARDDLVRRLRLRLMHLKLRVQVPLQQALVDALDLGVSQGTAQIATARAGRLAVRATLPTDVVEMLANVEERAREELRAGAAMLVEVRPGEDGLRDVEAAFARARGAVTRTRQAASWGAARSVAEGVATVAGGHGLSRLWIGERDACLHCLAYFGHIADAGELFPTGLTYARKPLTGRLPNPPLHPHCRCRIVVWDRAWGREYPDALKREAMRSVARGWSLESESNAARLDAAGRLLLRIQGDTKALPASVQDYAKKSVERGAFPRGRTFPV